MVIVYYTLAINCGQVIHAVIYILLPLHSIMTIPQRLSTILSILTEGTSHQAQIYSTLGKVALR